MSDRKFKYDICRVVGHETGEGSIVCTRCEYNIFAHNLEARLTYQFVGRKVTSELPYYIRDSTVNLLNEEVQAGEIFDFKNVEVVTYTVGMFKISFDVKIPANPLIYHHVELTF